MEYETKNYTDGSSAFGVAPLPDMSPEQQRVAELTRTRMPDGEIRMMEQKPQSPTIGRIVLFTPTERADSVNGAKEYVAVIGQVFADPGNPRPYCNLFVLPPFATPYWEGSVQEGDGENTSRTWRWPPRA